MKAGCSCRENPEIIVLKIRLEKDKTKSPDKSACQGSFIPQARIKINIPRPEA